MSDLTKMQKRIVDFRDERDWKQFHNPKDMALSLVLESAEVLEHFQWKSPTEIDTYVLTNKDDIGEELADTLYWVLLMANDLNINLEHIFENKMTKNEAKYLVEKSKGNHKKYTEF
jgi:dCTP diphosphatase